MVDMEMPGLSGIDVLDSLRRTGVSIPVILISGTPLVGTGRFFGVLRKPFSLRTMAQLIADAAEHVRKTRT
jgi:FixJ family two-component response regulator